MKNLPVIKPTLILLCSLLFLAGCSEADVPKEGDKYVTIPTPITDSGMGEVTEVFSLVCGHCRKMEQQIPAIEAITKVKTDKVHVVFNESAQLAAIIYYTAAIQSDGGVPDEALMSELFTAVQDSEAFMTKAFQPVLEKIFSSRGLVSPYMLDEQSRERVFSKLKFSESLTEQSQLQSVPAFIVKGTYLVQSSNHKDIEDIANTINYLRSK
jgi:hypothetical protein